MKKLTTLAILCLCSSLLANEGAVSIDLNSGKDIYSQCLDETIKELKKEDSEADINNAVVASFEIINVRFLIQDYKIFLA